MARAIIFGLGIGCCSLLYAGHTADACGVKLTLQATKGAKQIHPSLIPSRVLVLGNSEEKFDKALTKAGHNVEVADNVGKVKTKQYQVVLVSDDAAAKQAHDAWPDARVLRMERTAYATVASVEDSLQRKPTDTLSKPTVLASRDNREPIATGPDGISNDPSSKGVLVASGREATPASTARGEPIATRTEPKAEPKTEAVLATVVTQPERAPKVENTDTSADETESAADKRSRAVEVKPEKATPEPKPEKVAKVEKVEREHPAPIAATSERTLKTEKSASGGGKAQPEVFYGVNVSTLSARAEKQLQKQAEWMKAHPDARVTLEGHTDSTGPVEYNLALGTRRAEAARDYLVAQGISDDRIKTISYGEERPAYSGSDDWKNRRVAITQGIE